MDTDHMEKFFSFGDKFWLLTYPTPLPDFIGTVCWEQPIYVFAYPIERFASYIVSDMDWTSWCRIGKRIEVMYDTVKGGRPVMPVGYVLPDDWTYKCEGYVDPINIRVALGMADFTAMPFVTKISGV